MSVSKTRHHCFKRSITSSFVMFLTHNQMFWTEYFTKMLNVGLPELVFYWELQHDRCPRPQPPDHLKDVIKNNLRSISIDTGDWEKITVNWSTWKKMTKNIVKWLKHGELNTLVRNEHFWSRTLYRPLTVYGLK